MNLANIASSSTISRYYTAPDSNLYAGTTLPMAYNGLNPKCNLQNRAYTSSSSSGVLALIMNGGKNHLKSMQR